jgi:hypothetical protein
LCDSDHKLSATDNGGVLHPTAAKEARVKLNTEFTGLISFQLVLVLVAVVLVANPLSMLLFIHLSFTRTVYLLLFDTLIAAAVFYAVRHIRRGRRRDLVGAFGLLIALPVVMLLAEPAIVAMTERMAVSDAPENEVSAGSSIHRPDPLLGWVPVPGATGRHAIEGSFDVTYELDEKGRKAISKNADAERTIHFFGDSFTFGYGVSNEDTSLNVVAQRLGKRATVANWAVMGYGLEQMFLRLREVQGEIHRGDVVVFSPLSHDLWRNLIAKDFVCDVIYRHNFAQVRSFPILHDGVWQSVPLEKVCPSAAQEGDLLIATIRRRLLAYRIYPAIIENADRIFAQAKAFAERHGARFQVVFLVEMYECVSGSFAIAIDRLRTPFSTLMENCPAPDEADTFVFPTNPHLNAAGNRWQAMAILDFLNRRVLDDSPIDPALS